MINVSRSVMGSVKGSDSGLKIVEATMKMTPDRKEKVKIDFQTLDGLADG